ncbi:DC-STAMP domain-containing protein 1-like [Limulus polyphemus]|uniref:DC-STAMP domain-containing protein 1-like n=1 Tax=Limulus polyphemus TaxID=6850 RepID=A0ABM1TDB0_LIMPO|nr:DC-STAMP domain-containing protein 1-like [Limulus polyphemus]
MDFQRCNSVENHDEQDELKKDIDYVDEVEDREPRAKMIYQKYMTMVSSQFGEEVENEYAMKLEFRCEDGFGTLQRSYVAVHFVCTRCGRDYIGSTIRRLEQRIKEQITSRTVLLKSRESTVFHFNILPFSVTDVFSMGVVMCRKSFKEAEDRCFQKLSFLGYLLCWPMKLTFLCRLVNVFLGDRMCEGHDPVNVGFGESYATGEKLSTEMKMNFNLNMQYKLVIPGQQVDQITPQDVSKAIENEFNVRKRYFDYIFKIICRLIGFLFLLVFLEAKSYNNSYLRDIQFDNFHITAYFRHIDARRKRKGKRTLLPLKKGEKKELLDALDMRMSVDERSKIILVFSVILFIDKLLLDVLLILKRHSRIDYHQLGTHDVRVIIYGNGAVANLVRAVLKGFNQTHTLDQISTSAVCLPSPRISDEKEITVIYIIYLLIWILFFMEAYGIRLRSRICGFFYPKRSKKRILFLYNEWLKRRHSYLHYMKHKIRKAARRKLLSPIKPTFLDKLFKNKPFVAKLFTLFVPSDRKCLLCEDPQKADFHFCENKKCNFCYCKQCWSELKQCYACNAKDYDHGSDITDDDDDW